MKKSFLPVLLALFLLLSFTGCDPETADPASSSNEESLPVASEPGESGALGNPGGPESAPSPEIGEGEESDASSSVTSSADTSEIQITSPRERSFSYELEIEELTADIQHEPYVHSSMVYSSDTSSGVFYFKVYEEQDKQFPDRAALCREKNGKTETLVEINGAAAYVQKPRGNKRGIDWIAGNEWDVYCYTFETKSVSKLDLPDQVEVFTLSDDYLVYKAYKLNANIVSLKYVSLSAGEVKEITSGLPGSAAVPAIVNGTVAAPVYKDGRYSMVIYDLNAGTEKTYPLPDEVENLLSIQTHGTTAILTALENPKDYTSVITRIYHIPTERVIRQFRGLNHSFEKAFFVNDIQVIYCAENNEVWLYDITTNYCTPVQELSGKQYRWMYGNILIGNSDIAVITS